MSLEAREGSPCPMRRCRQAEASPKKAQRGACVEIVGAVPSPAAQGIELPGKRHQTRVLKAQGGWEGHTEVLPKLALQALQVDGVQPHGQKTPAVAAVRMETKVSQGTTDQVCTAALSNEAIAAKLLRETCNRGVLNTSEAGTALPMTCERLSLNLAKSKESRPSAAKRSSAPAVASKAKPALASTFRMAWAMSR
eukprot:CAMPEP_0171140196 /NCGR_PEP_ID=MMETSP0766_2-20121228/138264_1 /TAXON_ID=439317 /ORGANISM="Gambierdiscus australes, Strain CAWD 149" /LENGTH=194 /DNA_ID=CAMNT_0011603879 /DNA_START=25 /DNA_END=606 /DNA_ORIENTATION=+